jgi:LysM domain
MKSINNRVQKGLLRAVVHVGRYDQWSNLLLMVCVLLLHLSSVQVSVAEDCEPKRNCDATRDCSLQVDTRSCGHDVTACVPLTHMCTTVHVNDPVCEAAKAAQNQGYAIAKGSCETQKTLEKGDCERVKFQMKKGCELGIDGPFSCTADEVLGQLRTAKQDGLTDFDELSGALTTPFKKAGGQLSWRETACQTTGATGKPYRNSQRSTDGFCTIDVQLISFSVDGHAMPGGTHFIRLEVLPGGKGAQICANRTISTLDKIQFSGPIKIDKHPGQRWLEVHVTDDFGFVNDVPMAEAQTSGGSAGTLEPKAGSTYTIRKGDSLAKIAERAYGKQIWPKIYNANRRIIKYPDLIYPNKVLMLPR